MEPNAETLDQIIDRGYQIGMLQRKHEILHFAQWLSAHHISNFCEIGTWKGGSFQIWDYLSQPGEHIAIDPNSQQGIILTPEQLATRQNLFASLKPVVSMLLMDSQRAATRQAVEHILDGKRLDFLFIDGDHSQHAVHHDYMVYGQFVRRGGVIALHDVNLYPGCRALWKNISANNPHARIWTDTETPSGIGAIILR